MIFTAWWEHSRKQEGTLRWIYVRNAHISNVYIDEESATLVHFETELQKLWVVNFQSRHCPPCKMWAWKRFFVRKISLFAKKNYSVTCPYGNGGSVIKSITLGDLHKIRNAKVDYLHQLLQTVHSTLHLHLI